MFTFLYFTKLSTKVLAVSNTFDCVWNATSCRSEPDSYADCDKGYDVNSDYCKSITDKATCQNAKGVPCITKATQYSVTCDKDTGIQTAIGCIHVLESQESFIADILKWAIGIGGGIAFLLIIYAGFMIMTASGVPERIKAGQELMTSAIAGIILLIFSIFILKLIGIDILGLGNWGFGT